MIKLFLFLFQALFLCAAQQLLPGPSTTNIHYNCRTPNGTNICCALVDESNYNARKEGMERSRSFQKYAVRRDSSSCSIVRSYHPSPFENQNFLDAIRFQSLKTPARRYEALSSFFLSEVNILMSEPWLKRINKRMNSRKDNIRENDVDWKYLPRFHVEMHCDHKNYSWNEWIEPLTLHCRHPLFLRDEAVKLLNADYILLKSKASHYNNSANMKHGHVTKHFLIDAGSTTFDSSLIWFCCGYEQVGTQSYFSHRVTSLTVFLSVDSPLTKYMPMNIYELTVICTGIKFLAS